VNIKYLNTLIIIICWVKLKVADWRHRRKTIRNSSKENNKILRAARNKARRISNHYT